MELRQLKTFYKVATLLSFQKAATDLNYAQSTVSAQIKALEDELETPLFDRLNKKITLTDAGVRLLKYSQRLVLIEKEAFVAVKGEKELQGSLSIRIPQTIATCHIPPILVEFQNKYPNVNFELNNCTVHKLTRELSTGTIDLAFLLTESISSKNFKGQVLGVEQLVLVSHPSHPLAHKNEFSLKDIQGQVLLLSKTDCDYPLTFKSMLKERKIKPAIISIFSCIESMKQCVMAGLGITLLPKCAVQAEIDSRTLSVLPWAEEPLEVAIFIIWHRDKWISPILKAFLETLQNKFQVNI